MAASDDLTAAYRSGLNSGTLVAVKRNPGEEKFHVLLMKHDGIKSVGHYSPLA